MNQKDRARRAAKLCIHTIANIGMYRGTWEASRPALPNNFWIATNSNFLDIAILEWCKLFADRRGKHAYSRVVHNADEFQEQMLVALQVQTEEWDSIVSSTKDYRDKFIAHLDEETTMNIPYLDPILASAMYLFDYLTNRHPDYFPDLTGDARETLERHLELGRREYLRSACSGDGPAPSGTS